MSVLSHEACGCYVLAARGSSYVVNSFSGEVATVGEDETLHYDGRSWGYLSRPGCAPRWLRGEVLHTVRGVHASGRHLVKPPGQHVLFYDDALAGVHEVRYKPLLSVRGHDDAHVQVWRLRMPVAGSGLAWQMRDFQAVLDLDISPDFALQWVSRQWERWLDAARTVQLPTAACAISFDAAALRAAGGSSRPAAELSLQEFSLPSQAMLFVVSRWTTTLKGQGSRALAVQVLRSLLAGVCGTWLVDLGAELDVNVVRPLSHGTSGALDIEISSGFVAVRALLERFSWLRKASTRSGRTATSSTRTSARPGLRSTRRLQQR